MPPKKGDVPGYYPVSDDENSKGPKKSRRSGKKTKSTEVGPSSIVPLPSPTPSGYGPGSSNQKPSSITSTGTVQTPAPTGARQPIQNSSQPAQAISSSIRPAQSSAHTDTRQAGQATMPAKSANTPGPTGMIPDRRLDGSHVPKENVSAGVQPEISHGGDLSKEKGSNLGGDKQQFARLKGHPSRPEHGTEENMVFLVFNHFQLKHRPSLLLWHYDIKVDPEVKGRKLTQIIKTALNHGHYKEHKSYMATDFSAVMLSAQELPYEYAKFKLSYQTELETQASDNAKEYWVSLVLNGTIDVSKIYLDSTETSSNGFPVEQALDIVLGHHRKLSDNIAIVNKRKAFSIDNGADEYDAYDLGDGALTALRGYFSSVRMSESGPLVNINVSHGAFYKAPRPLSEVIQWFESLRSVDRSKISGLLRGLRVNSSHIPRIWTIWGYPRDGDGKGYMLHPPRFNPPGAASYTPEQVSFFLVEKPKESSRDQAQVLSDQDKENAGKGDLHPHDKSCSCQGTWLTVAKYFATVRKEPISNRDLRLPLVNVGSNKRPTYLPSHVCEVSRGQISNLKIEPSEMIKFAVRDPNENANSITNKAFKTLGLTSDSPELKRFGVSVGEQMIKLKGRRLPLPTLLYGNKTASLRGSSWTLKDISFRRPMELNNWACLRICLNKNKDGSIHDAPLKNSLTAFQKHLKSKGIIAKENDNHGDLLLDGSDYGPLDRWFDESRNSYHVGFLLVVLPNRPTSEMYNHIKRYGDVKHGIHTVCVKAQKFGSLPYDDNVALKVNLKLGGTNHVLDDRSYGPLFKDKTMVVGIDVTHPAPGDDGAPSVAAVVASRDDYLSQWPADLRVNNRREEIVKMLREMLRTRLEHFKEKNESLLPKNILIYRDGVGEGQYKIVLDEELPRLRRACQDVYGKQYDHGVFPRISLIVVGKRHHTRFYQTDDKWRIYPERQGNPICGTLVDRGITQNCNWDFFLQSHTAITGTARPAHYFVLVDEIFRKTSDNPVRALERLTHNLCYLYGKATTSVSIPPPVYYADKACDRGRRYLSRVFDQSQRRGHAATTDAEVKVHEDLKKTMFYI